MKITADTNVLLRAYLGEDKVQGPAAVAFLADAETVAVPLQSLCELAWVLTRRYKVAPRDVAEAIRLILTTENVAVDRPAVLAGLAVLDAGGDFADVVIAHEGRRLGGETFVSFDKAAVPLLRAGGIPAQLAG